MWMAKWLAKPNGYRISKPAHGEQNEISDVKVMVYGNTAMATGAWTGKGVESDGSKADSHERWTDAWVKMPDDEWQCVAGHQFEVKKQTGAAPRLVDRRIF